MVRVGREVVVESCSDCVVEAAVMPSSWNVRVGGMVGESASCARSVVCARQETMAKSSKARVVGMRAILLLMRL